VTRQVVELFLEISKKKSEVFRDQTNAGLVIELLKTMKKMVDAP
jgi:hypothetical protein